MRLLFGRPVRAEGRQPEHVTAPAVHLPTLSVSQRDQLDGDPTRVACPPVPVSCSPASASQVSPQELTAPESGLATVNLKEGMEYGFRPTLQDSTPWNRIVVTIFRTATTNSPTQILGEVGLTRGGPAVDSKTIPSFKVAVPKVSLPVTQTSSTR
jgi:hypothetical protein